MDHTSRKASDPERRSSIRNSTRSSMQQEAGGGGGVILDIDDDDYALLALGISDGFRPQPVDTTGLDDPQSSSRARPDPSAAPAVTQTAQESTSQPRLNRSSISKPHSGRDSFTLRHDGAMGHVAGPSHSRLSSASTEAPYVPEETPYNGPSAPSHPYQMYSQNPRLARTLSVTTTSSTPTTRPESEYDGPSGPTHPYSMYPQNPFVDTNSQVSVPAVPAVPAIPVGFTGASDPYQRRIGPEGEEAGDIIGPDGHTEELPPYTRYPDEYYNRKIRDTEEQQNGGPSTAAAAAATVVPSGHTRAGSSVGTVPGAGGLGLAARNPEFDSVEDVGSPHSRQSARSFTTESHHEINTAAAAEVSEKPKLNKFQRFAKRKACGVVPYWAICMTVTAVIIVIVIIGAVVGTLLSKHKKPPRKGNPSQFQGGVPTVTLTYDASAIPTPTDLPPLPTGVFGLPLSLNKSPNTCFENTAQSSAWTCNLVFGQAVHVQMTISQNAPQLGQEGSYDIFLDTNTTFPGGDRKDFLAYGAQPPTIQPAMSMQLVNDTFDRDRGPAWFRMLPYNKTVVVPEDLLSADSSSNVRRNGGDFMPRPGDFQRKDIVPMGSKPWICNWPETYVEVFIYAEQNSSWASQTKAMTGTITPPPGATPTVVPTATGTGAPATVTSQVADFMPFAPYPRAVKVKERRLNWAPSPYCVQVTVMPDNTTQPVTDDAGEPVIVYIAEDEPGPEMPEEAVQKGRHGGYREKRERDALHDFLNPRDSDEDYGDMSACGCMWFSS
ncbi:hypothetical protein KVR01_012626 [Diaporthe batatas]|uniref:uncharacterized protein n=1 Tax=Diaporthe batatas TaxID=748121 RepID=UPI001D039463|nr:uncharacterized protein KVR01_012626 [Diaporthe batatas]KAG8157584.1 hypothetical protein KVR01_012626 [Diaporthe batatas]